jgi:hypothetical protein
MLSEVLEVAASPARQVSESLARAEPFAKPVPKNKQTQLIGASLLALAAAAYFGLRSTPESEHSSAKALAPSSAATTVSPAATPDPGMLAKLTDATLAVSPKEQPASPPEPQASAPAQDQALKPAQDTAAGPAFAASLAKLSPPGAGRAAQRREAAAVAAAAAAAANVSIAPAAAAASPMAERYYAPPRTRSPGEGLDLKQPNIGNCTDAVAALGLCTPESNPRRP